MGAGSFGTHGILVDLDEFVAIGYDILSRSHIVISDVRRRGWIRHRSFSEKRLLVVHFYLLFLAHLGVSLQIHLNPLSKFLIEH